MTLDSLLTRLRIPVAPVLKASSRILMLGSCFADEMTGRMAQRGLPVTSNPFGTLYNPLSIAACLDYLLSDRRFTEADLVYHNGLYHSMLHHGDFSSPDQEQMLRGLNDSLAAGREALSEADTLVLTWGTAWVYEQQGRVVANCHKMPESEFLRRRLTTTEIVATYTELLRRDALRDKQIILTVSPIRHVRDGLPENALSKAVLRVAASELTTSYFPSYELLTDELRDYRWYAADLCHPSEEAINYVWERFEETYFPEAERQILREVLRLKQLLAHRPLHPDSEASRQFRAKAERDFENLCSRYPWIR